MVNLNLRRETPRSLGDEEIRIWHILNSNYGWIPIDEFMDLPVELVQGLLNEIKSDNEEMSRQMKRK